MTRGLTAGMITEVTGVLIRPFMLIKFAFDSGDFNLWSGTGDLVWSGDTYTGAGNFLGFSSVSETEEIIANGLEISLSAIPSSTIAIALAEPYQGRTVTMWVGAFDSSKAIIADPEKIFSGIIDVMNIKESGGSARISVQAESQLRSLSRPSARKWSSADQRARRLNDAGFDELAQMQDDPLRWGA